MPAGSHRCRCAQPAFMGSNSSWIASNTNDAQGCKIHNQQHKNFHTIGQNLLQWHPIRAGIAFAFQEQSSNMILFHVPHQILSIFRLINLLYTCSVNLNSHDLKMVTIQHRLKNPSAFHDCTAQYNNHISWNFIISCFIIFVSFLNKVFYS